MAAQQDAAAGEVDELTQEDPDTVAESEPLNSNPVPVVEKYSESESLETTISGESEKSTFESVDRDKDTDGSEDAIVLDSSAKSAVDHLKVKEQFKVKIKERSESPMTRSTSTFSVQSTSAGTESNERQDYAANDNFDENEYQNKHPYTGYGNRAANSIQFITPSRYNDYGYGGSDDYYSGFQAQYNPPEQQSQQQYQSSNSQINKGKKQQKGGVVLQRHIEEDEWFYTGPKTLTPAQRKKQAILEEAIKRKELRC
ncbi:unnamed protein product [Ambrosiozyma monospora]|uniref:Unnamed protein product n=1 Tax=Ambrosiozyma monospora TaxID=43982 RepID=A0ACB5U7Z9_AMBMO|nr:unnamed protein product [Ambrosiozyma monospora]